MAIEECLQLRVGPTIPVSFYSKQGNVSTLRVKDPFSGMMELMIDVIGSLSKGLLHSAIPVGLDQVLQVAAVGGTGMGDICMKRQYMKLLERAVLHTMVREPSLKLSFMPFVVDC